MTTKFQFLSGSQKKPLEQKVFQLSVDIKFAPGDTVFMCEANKLVKRTIDRVTVELVEEGNTVSYQIGNCHYEQEALFSDVSEIPIEDLTKREEQQDASEMIEEALEFDTQRERQRPVRRQAVRPAPIEEDLPF